MALMKIPFLSPLGLLSLSLSVTAPAAILINEVNLNPNGSDDNYEFIELRSTANGMESCSGLSLVVIVNDRRDDVGTAKNLGEIDEVWSLEGMSTGANGLLLLGDGYDIAPRGGPWSAVVAAQTAVGDPRGMSPGNIGPNDGLSILLVRNFTGVEVNNAWPDVDVDNNLQFDWLQTPVPAGGLSAAPWSEVVDSIGTRDFNEVNEVRGIPADPYTASSANLYAAWLGMAANTLKDRDADTFARRSDGLTPHAAKEWYGAKFEDLAPPTSTAYRTNRYFGLLASMTPGQPNFPKVTIPPPTGDTDGDGIPDLLEGALGLDPANAAVRGPLPSAVTVPLGGVTYPGFTYQRRKGGTAGTAGADYATGTHTYTVETSMDLQSWAAAGSGLVQVSAAPNADNVTETVVLRVSNPQGKVFMRLKVGTP